MIQPVTKVILFSEVNSKFGLPFLRELIQEPSISVEALVTSPEGKLCSYYIGEPDPVDLEKEAKKNGIPVLRPNSLNDSNNIELLKTYAADYFIIANYQKILKEAMLSIPKEDTINFHPSPLPRYAGLAPFFWMAKNGEKSGGVSCIQVVPEIDAGPILAQMPVVMSGTETALEIRNIHFKQSIILLKQVLPKIKNKNFTSQSQILSNRTYYGQPKEEDYFVNWEQDIETILRTIRAGYPQGAFAFNQYNQKIRILKAERTYYPQPIQALGVFCEDNDKILVSTKDGWIHLQMIIKETLSTSTQVNEQNQHKQVVSI
ncbi:methionyl-tRNA formyltransferase [Bacillus cereus]|uniref:methionyl-tRNA formyltransferase n=1 Tax=Bacillus TaxID=1386 RepID=UPI0007A009D9|nr:MULTISPECIES: formyltransferase family protein [Bacillus]KYZ65562.1 methionyl-tRNA formyltransferase [Bacillus sp. GZT]MCU5325392.1 formyltransferase family protein [Bacillus cereus]MCU5713793.1 formyltransferase family protein [Bacillus cereus]MDA1841004.1 formyltransferase family protein [Bacillus cereus]RAT06458.1 methionyl-tRNA formyltransferase [Bacillus cereus]